MPFLTQGKTNWKFLLIVVVLAIIVGGGVFYQWQALEEETETSSVEYIEPKFVPVEKRCEGILDLVKLEECYADIIDLAKETRIESYCRSIPTQFLNLRWDCFKRLAISNDNLLICENIETTSLSNSCIQEYFEEKAKETVGWKTFKNEVFGYEVKYPPDWETDFQNRSLLLFIDTESLLIEGVEGGEDYEEAVAIFATSSLSSEGLKSIYHFTYLYPTVSKTFFSQIGGAEAEIIYELDLRPAGRGGGVYSILRKENIVLDVRRDSMSPGATFFKILSTLKFFEPAEKATIYHPGKYEVSEWKIYKDENSKFQVDYPNGWIAKPRCVSGDVPGSVGCAGNEFYLPFFEDELYLVVNVTKFESEEYAKAFCEGEKGPQYYLEKAIVGGTEGIKYLPIKPESGDIIEVDFTRGNHCYWIYSPFELGDILDHMLFTFRFLE